MNKLQFIVIILLSALLLQCATQKPKIVLLEERSSRLTPAHSLSYSSTFVIENYCESNRCANRIDKLVLKHYKKTNHSKHVIGLYKESETVNLKNFKEFPELAKKWNLDDYVLNYTFYEGKLIGKNKYKDGMILNLDTAKIKISDAPPIKN